MPAALTVTLDEATLSALDDLATRTHSTRDELVHEALGNFLELQAWQVRKIEDGIAAADRGEFAPDEDIERLLRKHGRGE